MLTDDGSGLEFYYNYLIYEFENGGEQLSAKHYLDDPESVSIPHPLVLPLSDFVQQALAYLALRYNSIQVLGNDGYGPLPEDVAKDIGGIINRHMTGNS